MMRGIDNKRIAAQIQLAQRITRGGEVDMDVAVKEREALADRIDHRRAYFLAWMREKGWPQLVIDGELADLDELVIELRTPPFSQRALGGFAGMLG